MPINMSKTFRVTIMPLILLTASVGSVSVASAQTAPKLTNPVDLSSEVKIERTEKDANGRETSTLRDPKDVIVVPGDKVVFILNIVNSGLEPAAGFRATNPIPASVAFQTVDQDWAEVSVDGGANWGKLSALSVSAKAADTGVAITRPALPEDVTHVRWVFANAIAPASKSSVSYRGVVK